VALIGITTYHREREGRARFTLPDAYVEAVRGAGGVPVLLPPGEERAGRVLDRLDGLVLSGGGDLDPGRLGLPAHPAVYFVCPERDAFEVELALGALERDLPLFAICRGAQVLNAALGGDLHVHLEDVVGREVVHRESRERHTTHPVRVDPASELAARLESDALAAVASWHHQAVRRLGRGLRAVAWAPDGTVEALELAGAPQVTAVQWHPELQIEPASPQRRLFADFVGQAGRRASRARG
jgi:putative glutamine amidotransferase